VFLTASAEARAERRYKQLIDKGMSASLPALVGDMQARDARDAERAVAPLKPAADAMLLDTTQMGIEAAVEAVLQHFRAKSS
jgi:cytidylate kinase